MELSPRLRSVATSLPFILVFAFAAAACKSKSGRAPGSGDAEAHEAGPVASGVPAPPDVAAAPADATTSPSGLASKVLAKGTGTEHPLVNDSVKVDYTGWTTDGNMFDSSVAQKPGRKAGPATLALNRVIPGWSEGLRDMVVGEKRRLWIPESLAYGGKPGAPQGMLVFDIELLDIQPGPKPPADVGAPPEGADKTPDGLASKILQPGTGKDHPKPNDGVKITFSLWKRDGTLLEETKDKPTAVGVSGLFEGFTEALELMVVGEKRMVWVPAALGMKPRAGGPPDMDVTMVLELFEILPGPKTPADVKAPPKDAIFEKDGLASKVLTKGKGTVHPTKTNSVSVQYAGWTTDGKMFDSSYSRGEPATIGVGTVIPGWSQALQLMVEGEKRRFWIPAELAYKDQPQGPQGMLVFDVELLQIKPDSPNPGMGPGMGRPGMGPGMGPPGMGHPGMGPGMGQPGMGRPGRPPGMGGFGGPGGRPGQPGQPP
jgi:FKBP-type peptidyl-prolyl cis-trans isomerase